MWISTEFLESLKRDSGNIPRHMKFDEIQASKLPPSETVVSGIATESWTESAEVAWWPHGDFLKSPADLLLMHVETKDGGMK